MKIWYFIFLFSFVSLQAQKVTVADEINIRNDFAYDILGQIEDNIVLYRNKGMDHYINVYDKNLRFKKEKELLFEKKKVKMHYIVPRDSFFNLVYSYKVRDTVYYKLNEYDQNALLTDSVTIEKVEDRDLPKHFRYVTSEDKSKSVLFAHEKGKILYMKVIDNNLKQKIWEADVELKNINLRKDFRKIIVTNDGMVLYLFEQDNSRFRREDHVLTLLGFQNGGIVLTSLIDLNDIVSCDLEMAYNNTSGNIVIAGLSSEKNVNAATDYYFINKHFNQFVDFEKVDFITLDQTFIKEVYGKKKNKEKELKDFSVNNLLLRQDGGFLMVCEMSREYQRRTAFNSVSRSSRDYSPGNRGWTDHYNEDIVMISVHPDGKEHWKNILYKKQFSQDDNAAFSSFFMFQTPSRLKVIYNDEIKNNNTVSEYVLNPLGQHERNSLLSTDYQNLRLRFRDAIQLSNYQLLVPSEKSYNLRLVKIEYEGL